MGEGISVIIPVYNGERFLAEAVRSVLDQSRLPDEIIVVDDGSTDATPQIIARLAAASPVPFHGYRQVNRGPAAARNTGIRLAHYDFLAFQDADDLWTPRKLEQQWALIRAEPPADIVIGLLQHFVDTTSPSCGDAQPFLPSPYPGYHLQNKLIRAQLFTRVGLLDETLTYGEDTDWLVRAVQAGAICRVQPEVVVYYRRHAHNMTNQMDLPAPHVIRALRRAVHRHRNQEGTQHSADSPPGVEGKLNE